MQITKSWLLTKPISFWRNLIYLLGSTSPYFGKLGWAFHSEPIPPEVERLEFYQSLLNQLDDNANPEQICRQLMRNLFWVAPDYNRTIITYLPIPPEEMDRQIGAEYSPSYPRYYVRSAPNNYRPLQAEEILPPDIKMFNQKLQVLRTSFNQRLMEERGRLSNQIKLVQQKLKEWSNLLTK